MKTPQPARYSLSLDSPFSPSGIIFGGGGGGLGDCSWDLQYQKSLGAC